jgi:hypothetical protein
MGEDLTGCWLLTSRRLLLFAGELTVRHRTLLLMDGSFRSKIERGVLLLELTISIVRI